MNVFIDTHLLLDVLLPREAFYANSARIWTLAETGGMSAFVSGLSLPNIFYLLRQDSSLPAARAAVIIVRDMFSLVPLDAQIVNQAIDADIADFEDAIQFFSAVRVGAAVLVTRNPRHFPSQGPAIQTPAEFLTAHFPA